MKFALHTASVAIVFLLMAVPDASAIQVSYTLLEEGGSGTLSGIAATQMDEYFDAQLGTYQFTGSIEPDRLGLIGVSSGFRAAVSRFVPGFSPEPGGGGFGGDVMGDDDPGFGAGGPPPTTEWTRVTIDTRAAGTFETLAEINGLSPTNEVGYIQFDWESRGCRVFR